jgi:hypothetical protein
MSEDELLIDLIERMVDHINILTTVVSNLSNQNAVIEERLASSSMPLLSDGAD